MGVWGRDKQIRSGLFIFEPKNIVTTILAILIVASGFSAAVETKDGFVENYFLNTPQGVDGFLDWSEPIILNEGNNIKICTVTLADDPGPVMEWLLSNDMKPAMLSPAVYRDYVSNAGESLESGATAAKACLAAFPFIRKVG